MPFALVIVGLILIITGAKDTYAQLGAQLKSDFTGPGNFFNWLVALGIVGGLGYIPELKRFSTWFLALILIAMVIRNGGVFDKMKEFLQQGAISPAKTGQSANAQGATPAASNVASYPYDSSKHDAAEINSAANFTGTVIKALAFV